jgi:predicted 3-demethylubiquinone-9 3-methyltransferase (glyoxalase superfamily)
VHKIITSLLMDHRIDEAVTLYLSIFKGAKLISKDFYGSAVPSMAGQVLAINFEIGGQHFLAINGGVAPNFTTSLSLQVICDDQAEVDRYWDALVADGGEEGQCGWLKDKFGLSWQIIPRAMPDFISGPDKAGSQRAMQAMMQMKKIDLAKVEAAYAG